MTKWQDEGARELPWAVIWVGIIVSGAFLFLGLVKWDTPNDIQHPSSSAPAPAQNGVWDKIPDECEKEGEQKPECLDGLSTQERDAITCAQEDGPGPCFWLDKVDGRLYFVPKE